MRSLGLIAALCVAIAAAGSTVGANDASAGTPKSAARKPAQIARKAPGKPAQVARKATPRKATARKATPRKPAHSSQVRTAPSSQARIAVLGSLRPPLGERLHAVAETRLDRIADQIAALYKGPLRAGTTSLLVVDGHTGEPIFSVDPELALNPASNVKLVSTASALDLLGPDFRYETRVLGPRPDADGVVWGDVYLLGSYDPTLGSKHVRALGSQLATAGVRAVTGDVLVGSTQTRDGIYMAQVPIVVTPGPLGRHPTVELPAGYEFLTVEVVATTTKARRAKLNVEQVVRTDDLGRKRLHVRLGGTIRRGKAITHWVATQERAFHAAHVLRAGLRDVGIDVRGDVRIDEVEGYLAAPPSTGTEITDLARHESAPLSEIVARINKDSINWLADRVIMTASAQVAGGKPEMARALDAMYGWLGSQAGIDRAKANIVLDTGSGLSYRTQLSAQAIVEGMRAAAASPTSGKAFVDSLSVAGRDGTLRNRFRGTPLAGTLRAKTGTLSTVTALAGFLEVSPERSLVFAIVSNGHTPRLRTRIKNAHERLVGLLYEYATSAPSVAAGR